MKLIKIICSHQDKQAFARVLQSHIENFFPEGCGDSSLEARYALLDIIAQIEIAETNSADHFLLNKRMRPFCKVALVNALEAGQIEQAVFDRVSLAIRANISP